MPNQEEHEKLENLVESPGMAQRAARTLRQAANSNQSLEGFEAINNERIPEEIVEPEAKDDNQKES